MCVQRQAGDVRLPGVVPDFACPGPGDAKDFALIARAHVERAVGPRRQGPDVFGLRRRPDLRVVIASLAPFAWYQRSVLAAYPDLNAPPVGDWIPGQPLWGEELVRLNPDRPLCRSGTEAELRFLRCGGNYVYFGNLVVEGWK